MVAVVAAGGLAVAAFGREDDPKSPALTTDTSWTLPTKPDPGVRDEVNRLLAGGSGRDAAQEELVYRCMALRGFSYIKSPVRAAAAPLPMEYGLSRARAARHGYDLGQRPPTPAPAPGAIDQTAGLSPATRTAWHTAFAGDRNSPVVRVRVPGRGVVEESSTGCLAAARTRVYGSPAQQIRAQNLAARLPAMARDRSAADPRLKRLNETWSACMAGKGYRGVSAPEDARAEAQMTTAHGRIRLAVADAGCESTSGYARERRLLEDRYYTAGLRYFGTGIIELRALNDRAAQQVKQILG